VEVSPCTTISAIGDAASPSSRGPRFHRRSGPCSRFLRHSRSACRGPGIWSQSSGRLALGRAPGIGSSGDLGSRVPAFTEDFAPSPRTSGGRTSFTTSLTGSGVSDPNDSGIGRTDRRACSSSRGRAARRPSRLGRLFADLCTRERKHRSRRAFDRVGSLGGLGVSTANNEDSGRTDWLVVPAPPRRRSRSGNGPRRRLRVSQFIGSAHVSACRGQSGWKDAMQADLVGPGITTFSNEAIFAERSARDDHA
jgi:hypothetical protein